MKLFIKRSSFSTRVLSIITLCLLQLSLAAGIEFSYENVELWAQEWSDCGGQRQSPVDINSYYFDSSHRDDIIDLKDYNVVPQSMKLVNNGHSVKMEYVWGDKVPILTGELLKGEFRLDSIHFHWDKRSANGSEHTFKGQKTAMEIHFVHYNTDYKSIEEAFQNDDGLAVIAQFIYIEKRDSAPSETQELHEVLSKFSEVPTPGSSVDMEPKSVDLFSHFDRTMPGCVIYEGSLTIPPCNENVMWVIDPYMHFIIEEQLAEIQEVVELDNSDDHNFRQVQPLYDRKLYLIGDAVSPV